MCICKTSEDFSNLSTLLDHEANQTNDREEYVPIILN